MLASEFYLIDEANNDSTCGELDIGAERTAFAWMEAYAALRVREELEAACKAVCAECESGTPLDDGDCEHYFGFRWMRRDCPAAPIRKRISELAGSEEGSR